MITTTKSRILALVLSVVLALGVIAAAPPALAATVHTVTDENAFLQAIENAASGDVIQLQNDIEFYRQNFLWEDGRTFTVDLNGYDLTGRNGTISMKNGSHLLLEGDGAFNLMGNFHISVREGSTLTFSNIYTTNNVNSAVFSHDEGSMITILGSAGGDMETTAGTSVNVQEGGEIVVMGNVDGTVTGTSGGTLTVYGDVNSYDSWNYYAASGTVGRVGAKSPEIYIHGNVYGNVYARFSTYLYIGGDITTVYFASNAIYGRYDNGGVYSGGSDAYGTARVEIGGDILGDSGPSVDRKGSVTVEGEILTTTSYVRAAKDATVGYASAAQVHLGREDYTTPTTKAGYRTYTNAPDAGVVWVKDSGAEVVAVTGVELNKAELELLAGDTQRLQAAVQPANATNQRVVWSSSAPDVIEVDQDGLVTAVEPGEAVVSVRTEEGEFGASCAVTVVRRPDMPTVSPSLLEVEVGERQTLTIHMGDDEHRAEGAALTGFDGGIIRVSADSVHGAGPHTVAVTGLARGSTTITLGWSGGSLHGTTQEIPVRVTDDSGDGSGPVTVGPGLPSGGVSGGSKGNGSKGGGSKGNGSKGGGSKGNGSKGGGSAAADGAKGSPTPPAAGKRSSNVDADGSVNSAAIQSELRQALASTGGDTVTLTARGATSISPATLKALADLADAAGKNVVLHADTLSADGRSVQGRLYVEPARLTGLQRDLQLAVYADHAGAASVGQLFSRWFGNRVRAVHCGQSGAFQVRQRIAVKVDLEGLDTDSLVFYSYHQGSNTYTRMTNPAYSIDSNGYLRFTTDTAGDIVISDQPLGA